MKYIYIEWSLEVSPFLEKKCLIEKNTFSKIFGVVCGDTISYNYANLHGCEATGYRLDIKVYKVVGLQSKKKKL